MALMKERIGSDYELFSEFQELMYRVLEMVDGMDENDLEDVTVDVDQLWDFSCVKGDNNSSSAYIDQTSIENGIVRINIDGIRAFSSGERELQIDRRFTIFKGGDATEAHPIECNITSNTEDLSLPPLDCKIPTVRDVLQAMKLKLEDLLFSFSSNNSINNFSVPVSENSRASHVATQ
mgnify:CR=1 FL=1